MDPETIQQRLAQAERHATEGRRLVARQEDLMANLAGQGFETTEAQRVLETLVHTLALHEAEVRRLRDELNAS